MKKYLKNGFAVFVAAALLFGLVMGCLAFFGKVSFAQNVVSAVLTPVEKGFDAVGRGISGLQDYFGGVKALKAENEELRRQLAEYREREDLALAALTENEFLHSQLDIRQQHPQFVFTTAAVAARDFGGWYSSFTIDKGSLHGIRAYDCVVSADGFVGYVLETGLNWATVVTVTDVRCSVGAKVVRTQDIGVAEGHASLQSRGLLQMKYLPKNAAIQLGDAVCTSGTGEIFPAGVRIGTVTEIKPAEDGMTQLATLKPSVELETLQFVLVVTDYAVSDGEVSP